MSVAGSYECLTKTPMGDQTSTFHVVPGADGTTFTAKMFQLDIDYAPDSILLSAESSSPGYLFLSEIFYPGWKASIDGRPETILRGNYLFRVIPITAGRHQVRFLFDPQTIKLGAGISVLTALAVLGILIRSFLKRRGPTKR